MSKHGGAFTTYQQYGVLASKNVALSPFGTVVAPGSNFAAGVIVFGLSRNSEFISLILCFTFAVVVVMMVVVVVCVHWYYRIIRVFKFAYYVPVSVSLIERERSP